MTEQHRLDRVIDEAAGQLVRGEPSHLLTSLVRARIERVEPPKRRLSGGLLWGSLALTTALGAVVLLIHPVHQVAPTSPSPRSHPIVSAELKPEIRQPSRPTAESASVSRPHEGPGKKLATTGAIPTYGESEGAAAIEPLMVDPLTTSPIELPAIDILAVAVGRVEIRPLTIEPLTSNN